MTWISWLNFFGLGCAALSVATWRVFKPKTFYAPPGKYGTRWVMVLMGGSLLLWLATKINWISSAFGKEIPSLYTGLFIAETHGRAIWYHIENATRTPRDLWEGFFGTGNDL